MIPLRFCGRGGIHVTAIVMESIGVAVMLTGAPLGTAKDSHYKKLHKNGMKLTIFIHLNQVRS